MIHGRFAFQAWHKQENINVFTMDDDGRNLKQLTDSPRFYFWPAFSPDGSKIVFVSAPDGSDDIFTMRFDGTEQTRITNRPLGCRIPRFSPDGTRIVFCGGGGRGHAVYIMNADGTNQVRITNGYPPYHPVFTADGDSVIYNDGKGNLYIVEADGSNHRPLFDQNKQRYEAVAVSPNGERIAFEERICHYSGDDYEYTHTIFTANPDGSRLTKLTGNFRNAISPTFSPDGSKIAFVGQKVEGAKASIYISLMNGSEPESVTDGSMNANFLSWAPIPR